MNIQNAVKEVLADMFGLLKENIKTTDSLINDIGLESLDKVEFLFELEDIFDIEIPDIDFEDLETVNDVVEYIQLKTNK